MRRYTLLLISAWCIYRSDGLWAFLKETLRYFALYGNPNRIARYWWTKLFGIPLVIRNIQGSKMLLNLKDKGIHADLFVRDIREPHATHYLQSILQPDWVAIDIGANIGYYALMEARICKKVYAIEPEPNNFSHLTENIKLNEYKNIVPLNYAVGNKEGTTRFSLGKASNWHKIALNTTQGKTIRVEMITLDAFLNEKVDFLRMDVEGYELNILKGAKKTIRKYMPRIFIETHRDELKKYGGSVEELLEFLAGYGYSLDKSFILARPGPTGKLADLLKNKDTRKAITTKGISSHLFFGGF